MSDMKRIRVLISAVFGFAVLAMASQAVAAKGDKQNFLGRFGDWYAYELVESGQRTCYMVSKPTRKRGKYKKRGDVVAFVTHRPKDGEKDVVNFQAGYTYKAKSKVLVKIAKETFALMTDRDAAWSKNAAADKKLVAAMVKGSSMVVTGTSKRGSVTTDSYSLRGFARARKRINKACKVK